MGAGLQHLSVLFSPLPPLHYKRQDIIHTVRQAARPEWGREGGKEREWEGGREGESEKGRGSRGGGENRAREKRGDAFLCWTERPVDFFFVFVRVLAWAAFGLKCFVVARRWIFENCTRTDVFIFSHPAGNFFANGWNLESDTERGGWIGRLECIKLQEAPVYGFVSLPRNATSRLCSHVCTLRRFSEVVRVPNERLIFPTLIGVFIAELY